MHIARIIDLNTLNFLTVYCMVRFYVSFPLESIFGDRFPVRQIIVEGQDIRILNYMTGIMHKIPPGECHTILVIYFVFAKINYHELTAFNINKYYESLILYHYLLEMRVISAGGIFKEVTIVGSIVFV